MNPKINPLKPKKEMFSVKGKTTIIHSIRVELNITMTEYAFLDFLRFWFVESKHMQKITESNLYQYTGIKDMAKIKRIIARLKIKKMLEQKELKTPTGSIVVMYPAFAFLNKFSKEDKFEVFWNLKDVKGMTMHRGNKAKALIMYNRLIKVINPAEIQDYFLKYKAFVDKTGQTQLHTSTWLNPDWAHYKDELIIVEQKTKVKEQIIHSIEDEEW